jgi:steroid delta-isomerase-like uncharacterized protein
MPEIVLPGISLFFTRDSIVELLKTIHNDVKNELSQERSTPVSENSHAQNNVDILMRVIQAFNDREMNLLEQAVTPQFVRHDLSGAFLARYTGGAEVTNFLQTLFAAFPNIQIEIQDIIASADRIAMRYQFTGTHKGILFGTAPTNHRVRFDGMNIYRFEEEKIAEVWQLWDWAGVLHQIGAMPALH